MNDFEPKLIKSASKYLDEKLQDVTKEKKPKAYILEEKKESLFSRIVSSIFSS
jgi:hypothetical protein